MRSFVITYRMGKAEDIKINVSATTEEEAIVFAKWYRQDAFSIEEVK